MKREHSATKCIPIVLFHSHSIKLKQEVNERLEKKNKNIKRSRFSAKKGLTIAIKSNFKLHNGKIVYAPNKGPTEMIALAFLEEDYNSNYAKFRS